MRTRIRRFGLILIGALGTTLALLVSEKAMASWMTPPWLRPRVHHWFLVSPDGKQVARGESLPGEGTRRRILDIETGERVEVDLTDPSAWINELPKHWYGRRQVESSDGATLTTITWTGHDAERTFRIDRRHHIWLTGAAGVVFESIQEAESFQLLRHDLANGDARTIEKIAGRWGASMSPDGERVLLQESKSRDRITDHDVVRILDATDGSSVGSIEAPWAVAWLGDGHRHVETQIDGRLTVLDLERDTRVPLDTHFSTLAPVHVLSDGRILLQDGDALTLHDGHSGALLRQF
jgi:hypothetical protein